MKQLILAFCLLMAACSHTPPPEPPPPPAPVAAVGAAAPADAAAPKGKPKPKPPVPSVHPVLPDDPNGTSVLIMPLHADAALKGSAHALDEMILAAVTHYKRYQVLGTEDLNAMLGVEKLKDAMGCDDVSCAAEIGGALGAPYLVSGDLTRLGDEVVLSLRLLDTRAAKILARGTARGGVDADDLTETMEEAVGETFGIPVASVSHAHKKDTVASSAPASPAPSAQMGLTYQAVANELSKRSAAKDFGQVMLDLDAYTTQNITAPPGSDVHELLMFYRVHACYMMLRSKCVTNIAQRYLQQWPDGIYASTVKSYNEQVPQLEQQRDQHLAQLDQQLQQIEARRRANKISDDQALEMSANLATSNNAFQRAAGLYEQLMNRAQNNEVRWFAFAEQCAVAHEQNQNYDVARAILERAQLRNSQMFKNRGMGLILSRLPSPR